MQNLPLAGFRPFLALIFLLSFVLSCRKDSLTQTENFPQIDDPKSNEKNFPLSITEARMYFEQFGSHPSSSFDDGESYTFLKTIEPDWDFAFIGHSQSGKEIVITPLADSSLNALNQGRAGAKLIFSKTTEDSISVNILIFLADTAYYQGNAGVLNFNTFTGLYLLLDIGQHFEAGLNVIAGSPVGRVKAIHQMGSQNSPEYREDAEDEDCPRTFESMLIPCDIVFACIDGFQLITVESADCTDAVWPTGGGGGGSGGGGGNGGNQTLPDFMKIFTNNIPLDLFLQWGGQLPIPIQSVQHLIVLNNIFHFSENELAWLIDHVSVIEQMYLYVVVHLPLNGDNSELVMLHLQIMMTTSEYYQKNSQANFPLLGSEAWAELLNFEVEAKELPHLTAAEKALAVILPIPAMKIYSNRTIAREKQAAFWGSGGVNVTWLGKGDAFLHTYYQAINTQDVGGAITKLFSDAHETEHPAVLHLETEMDLFNNSVGIQTGIDNPSANRHTMADVVHQKVLDGYCKYLDPVDHDLSPQYDGNCSSCLNGILPTTIMKPTNQ